MLAVCTAGLSLCFNHFLKDGMIFNKYFKWLSSFDDTGSYWTDTVRKSNIKYYFGCIIKYFSKSLGLCVYCNGTWVAAFYYIWLFPLSFNILLFLGMNWLFIHIGMRVFKV